jgi:capsular exopolysaccharide synthesis family protein
MEPLDLLRLLWRRKVILALSAVLGAVLALGAMRFAPLRYGAEAQLLVENRELMIPELNSGVAQQQSTVLSRTRTEADVLRSRGILERAVQDLDLADHPRLDAVSRLPDWLTLARTALDEQVARIRALFEEAATQPEAEAAPEDRLASAVLLLQRRLRVSSDEHSRVITVRLQTGSPTLSAQILNTLLERYIADDVSMRQQATMQAHAWLSERAAALREDVIAADARVQAFRSEHRLLDVATGSSLPSVLLNEQESRLSQARQEFARLQSALETARQSAVRGSAAGGAQETLSSLLIQRLRDREAEIRQRISNADERLGPRHPDRMAAEAELRNLRRQIDDEATKILTSISRETEIARQQVDGLQLFVDRLRSNAQRAASAEVTLAQLTGEAEAKRQVYNAFLTRAAQTQLASAQFPPARIVSPAVPPRHPDRLSNAVVAAFGAATGLFLTAGIALLRHHGHSPLNSAQELAAVTGLPNLGALPAFLPRRLRRSSVSPQLPYTMARNAVETLRAIRIALRTITPGGTVSPAPSSTASSSVVALITSSEVDEGKSTLAATLAYVSAADGLKVLLVEADLRNPGLGHMFGKQTTSRSSLEGLLEGGATLDEAVQVDPRFGLHYVVADGGASNPQRLLDSDRFRNFLAAARRRYDLVIIDSPPVLRVADALLISPLCDVILFTVAWERVPRGFVLEALDRLPADMRSRTATVLTQVPANRLGQQDVYSGYGPSPKFRAAGRLPAAPG